MPRMTSFPTRPEFDPARDYTVYRAPLKCAGVDYKQHQDFDKSSVLPRTLRQLYEQCVLKMKEEVLPPTATIRRKRVQLEEGTS